MKWFPHINRPNFTGRTTMFLKPVSTSQTPWHEQNHQDSCCSYLAPNMILKNVNICTFWLSKGHLREHITVSSLWCNSLSCGFSRVQFYVPVPRKQPRVTLAGFLFSRLQHISALAGGSNVLGKDSPNFDTFL